MKPQPYDAHRPMLRALREIIGANGVPSTARGSLDRETPVAAAKTSLIVESLGYEPWASATFVGQTHWLEVRLEGDRAALEHAAAQIEAQLRDAEIPVPGAIVADVAVQIFPVTAAAGGTAICALRLEVLTIDD